MEIDTQKQTRRILNRILSNLPREAELIRIWKALGKKRKKTDGNQDFLEKSGIDIQQQFKDELKQIQKEPEQYMVFLKCLFKKLVSVYFSEEEKITDICLKLITSLDLPSFQAEVPLGNSLSDTLKEMDKMLRKGLEILRDPTYLENGFTKFLLMYPKQMALLLEHLGSNNFRYDGNEFDGKFENALWVWIQQLMHVTVKGNLEPAGNDHKKLENAYNSVIEEKHKQLDSIHKSKRIRKQKEYNGYLVKNLYEILREVSDKTQGKKKLPSPASNLSDTKRFTFIGKRVLVFDLHTKF